MRPTRGCETIASPQREGGSQLQADSAARLATVRPETWPVGKPADAADWSLRAPVYPPALARRGMPPVVITAHLVFGTDGRVHAVAIVADSSAAAGHALFEDAARKAVHAWVFTPLVFTETTGGGSAPATLHSEAKPFSLWFEFSFRVLDGKPTVDTARR